jgi:hypothetical protein
MGANTTCYQSVTSCLDILKNQRQRCKAGVDLLTINKDGQGFNFEEIQGSIASNRGECLRRIACLVTDLEWGAQEAAIRL